MNAKKIIAPDMKNALKQVRELLGEEAVILSQRKVPEGIEMIASDSTSERVMEKLKEKEITESQAANWASSPNSEEVKAVLKKAKQHLNKTLQVESTSLDKSTSREKKSPPKKATLSEKTTTTPTSIPASTPKLVSDSSKTKKVQTTKNRENPALQSSYEAKAAASERSTIQKLENEVLWLRNLLDSQAAALNWGQCHQHHPAKSHVLQRLCAMGIASSVAERFVVDIDASTDEQQTVWRHVIEKFAQDIPIYPEEIINESGVFALIGPTGSGKTTSIAKIAAKCVQQYGSQEIALVSIDGVRMGANHQLNTLSQILNVPVAFCSEAAEVTSVLEQFKDRRLILVDTAGLPYNDGAWSNQLQMLRAFGPQLKCFITVACTYQNSVMTECFEQYAAAGSSTDRLNISGAINIAGAIATKLDEARRLGEVLSFLMDSKLPLAYVTHGLSLVEDISRFQPLTLIKKALELSQGHDVSDIEMSQLMQCLLQPERDERVERMAG